jgi:hypothetical protein
MSRPLFPIADVETLPRYGFYMEPVLPTWFKNSDASAGKLGKIVKFQTHDFFKLSHAKNQGNVPRQQKTAF